MIVLYILIVLIACMMVFLIGSQAKINESVLNIAAAHNQLVATTKEQFRNVGKSLGDLREAEMHEDPQITAIITSLENITKDIARLDAEVTRVAKDEKEIRSYYVNFREPVVAEDIESVDLPFPGDEDPIVKIFTREETANG